MIVAVLPILVAIDFGGVLWWTQYVAGLAIVTAFVIALPSLADWSRYMRPQQLLVTIPLLLWLAYSAFQTVSLPPSFVSMLSPGSHATYTQWLEPILPAKLVPTSFPISVMQDETSHAVALFGLITMLAWTSLRVFNTRARMIGLLSSIAITGGIIAILGITALLLPNIPFFEVVSSSPGSSFSTFVNRNNAALMLNLGLAASFGLLSWRLSALTGQELDSSDFEFNDLLALTSDRDSAIGVICSVLCIIGLLVCGSRAGLATVLFASLLSLGWIRKRRGFSTIPVVLIAASILAALLTVPLQLDLESIRRMKLFSDESQTILNDGRFDHWPESLQAVAAHLPAGSGLSTYSNAYLPYQNEIVKYWFVHADNLWLELLVEQGFVGISFAFLMMLVCVWCLQQLATSHDALDHGLRVTGWYCLGTILFSQTFDFGLAIPANLFVVTVLLSVIVTRSVETSSAQPDKNAAGMISRFKSLLNSAKAQRVFRGTQVVVVFGLLSVAYLSLGRLKADAVTDSLVRRTEQTLGGDSASLESIQSMRSEMADALRLNESVDLRVALAKAQHHLGRLEEVAAAEPVDAEQAKKIYRATSSRYRRLAGRSPSTIMNKPPAGIDQIKTATLPEEYTEAQQNYQLALTRSPLSREIIQGMLYLDFADPQFSAKTAPIKQTSPSDQEKPDPQVSKTWTFHLIDHLERLYKASPIQLHSLAVLAAQSQENTLAAKLWRQMLQQSPRRTNAVMKAVKLYNTVSLDEVLPERADVLRLAAQRIVKIRDRANYDLLPTMVEQFECEQCEETDEEAACFQLAGNALVKVKQHEEALSYYEKALELRPANGLLRLQYIAALRAVDRTREALTQARQGRQIDPSDKRFDAVIKQMADLQIGGS